MRIFLSFLLLGLQAQAKVCDSNEIIDNTCKFFDNNKSKAFIELSDGTKYRNPFYVAPKDNESQNKNLKDEPLEYADAQLEAEIALSNVIDNGSLKNLPAKSRKALGNPDFALAFTKVIYGSNVLAVGTSTGSAKAPWPITETGAKTTNLDEAKIRDIAGKMTEEEKQSIKNIAIENSKVTANINKVAQAKLENSGELTQQQKARAEKLFNQTRVDLIDIIKKGRPTEALTPEERVLILKIETVKFMQGDNPATKDNEFCKTITANAFYKAENNSFYFCKSMYNLTDAELVKTIGHEMSHAIDPCACGNPLQKLDKDRVDSLSKQAGLNADNAKNLQYIRNSFEDNPYTNMSFELDYSADLQKFLSDNKLFEKVTDGVPMRSHPLNSIRQCFLDRKIFQEVSDQDIEKSLDNMKQSYERIGANYTDEDRKIMRDVFNKSRNCIGTGTLAPEFNEVFGDIYGSAVLAKHLQRNPPQNDAERYAIIGEIFGRSLCDKWKNNTVADRVNAARDITKRLLEPHPMDKKRAGEVLLKMPGIGNHFNCEPDPNSCLAGMKPVAVTTSSNVSEKKAASKEEGAR